jgi:hypothetical protein
VSLLSQRDMISDSSTTVIVPADVPNRRTDAKTNVSDTDTRAGRDDIAIVKEPVRRVRTASTNHWLLIGDTYIWYSEWARTSIPATVTPTTYVEASGEARLALNRVAIKRDDPAYRFILTK